MLCSLFVWVNERVKRPAGAREDLRRTIVIIDRAIKNQVEKKKMTQWRGMRPPRTKQYGLVGQINMLGYSSPGIDMNELRNRGWTIKLIEKYLGEEDRRDPVAHWANFAGKKVYFVARVERAEAMPEFEVDFIQSAKRRKLPQEFVDTTLKRCRSLRNGNHT